MATLETRIRALASTIAGTFNTIIHGKASAAPAGDDELLIYDTSAGTHAKAVAAEVAALALGINGYRSGQYYCGFGATGTASTMSLTANRIFFMPFVVGKPVTFTKLGIRIGGTAVTGGTIRLGVYTATAGLPDVLLVDAGTVSTAVANVNLEAVVNLTLEPGFYFLAAVTATASVTATTISQNAGMQAHLMGQTTSQGQTPLALFKNTPGDTLQSPISGSLSDSATAPALWMRL